MNISSHAEVRLKQRGIPMLVVDALYSYGAIRHDHRGCSIYHFDKTSKRRLEKGWGRLAVKRFSDLLDSYLVVSGKNLITVGRRYKRLPR